ncbi:UDP-N-acetylmuramoyl-tripeptide--D-alanyl-D-alanine ligase [Herbiconiux flava]|uniref:UDP-N-acetylmuramoyl-tripeptide--D-alanyl-D-alanine ligase n=1 Tax=Herbiconiux flava TaxID=881268 RepID=A0A852SR16_9MICO|nr:UDP-N-acetylmuramoyl-tripeptide--D-alanyl-D-alanine ligase [Herbiconiux flava]NYD71233.1 UDP-N-acetylmuramoyl-tripeptide--D-alanyl-D-alanine ligase [Herbiconiux flava]GLK18803.1 UDP-N-acetylmuramoyl-tripeptide--D-alanyl-D-alanine ligase [Herbiconiux flava]
MLDLTLTEIAEALQGELVITDAAADAGYSPATVVNGTVDTDSRLIGEGDVFVAKRGEFDDGHRFVGAAVESGAALVVVEHAFADAEREAGRQLPVAQIVVDDSVIALGHFATDVVSRVRASGNLKIVGITGSNGKTTTKNLLRAVLERVGETVAPRDSFNNEVGAPLTMLKLTPTTRFLVAEMGASGKGEITRLIRMAKPDVGVVLTVGLAHAGEFGGIETTLATKTEMVIDLDESDVAVLNRDDARVAGMAGKTRARVLWFGLGDDSEVRATEIEASASGTTFILHLPDGQSRPVRFAVLGEHHVMNALAAASAAHVLGVAIDDIVGALETVTRAERWRMEVMGGGDRPTVINDAYNASPDSMAAALKTLAQIAAPGQRTVAVLGEMSELGPYSVEEHDRIGRMVVRLNIGKLFVVGEGARAIHLAAEHEGSWGGEAVFAADADEAYALIAAELRPDDLVLVKSSNSARLRFLGDRIAEATT